jgi:hypothetical protein
MALGPSGTPAERSRTARPAAARKPAHPQARSALGSVQRHWLYSHESGTAAADAMPDAARSNLRRYFCVAFFKAQLNIAASDIFLAGGSCTGGRGGGRGAGPASLCVYPELEALAPAAASP